MILTEEYDIFKVKILTGDYIYMVISVILQGHLQEKKVENTLFQNDRRHQKLENHGQYRGLHVYRISMIVVGLITKIKEFDTDIIFDRIEENS